MIASGIIVTLIGYFSGLDILKAFGGVLLVAMWGTSWMFRPPATAFEVARADSDAGRVAATAVAVGRLAAERDQAAARPAEVAGTTVASADLSRAAAVLYSPART